MLSAVRILPARSGWEASTPVSSTATRASAPVVTSHAAGKPWRWSAHWIGVPAATAYSVSGALSAGPFEHGEPAAGVALGGGGLRRRCGERGHRDRYESPCQAPPHRCIAPRPAGGGGRGGWGGGGGGGRPRGGGGGGGCGGGGASPGGGGPRAGGRGRGPPPPPPPPRPPPP